MNVNAKKTPGRLLGGGAAVVAASYKEFNSLPVDLNLLDQPTNPPQTHQKTIAKAVSVSGPGTFAGKSTTKITFEPTDREGWWLDRTDLPYSLPVRVAIDNVWTTGLYLHDLLTPVACGE